MSAPATGHGGQQLGVAVAGHHLGRGRLGLQAQLLQHLGSTSAGRLA
jgi:hypothetical protein